MEFVVAGVSKEELDQNSERIREVLDWVVNNGEDLDALLEVQVDDSISCHSSSQGELPTASSSTLAPAITQECIHATSPEKTSFGRIPGGYRITKEMNLKILIIDDNLGRKLLTYSLLSGISSDHTRFWGDVHGLLKQDSNGL